MFHEATRCDQNRRLRRNVAQQIHQLRVLTRLDEAIEVEEKSLQFGVLLREGSVIGVRRLRVVQNCLDQKVDATRSLENTIQVIL